MCEVFKVNTEDIKRTSMTLTINFEQIFHCSGVAIANFEQ